MTRILTTIVLAVSLSALAGCAVFRNRDSGSAVLPSYLTGVWVTEGAVLSQGALYEGFAIYILSDGRGAIVAGPPPVGLEVALSYEVEAGLLRYTYEETESDGNVESGAGRFYYDRGENVLRAGESEDAILRRERPEVSQELEEALGLEGRGLFKGTRRRLGLE
ncbi:MAG: hypothetical protein ACR2RV_19225 [Verrucomicrobiales bacterium]